eukprot:TRINITY_DN28956_c0_g1_i1.p1 TRINITY_DN28956_c0_g1~~TRINITY_DN28956_c0_g1_i1.p1  ORF type:complete len:527 (+),score=68.87 TRINITY_DN28956_c0_g1_i1:167-1747(+)
MVKLVEGVRGREACLGHLKSPAVLDVAVIADSRAAAPLPSSPRAHEDLVHKADSAEDLACSSEVTSLSTTPSLSRSSSRSPGDRGLESPSCTPASGSATSSPPGPGPPPATASSSATTLPFGNRAGGGYVDGGLRGGITQVGMVRSVTDPFDTIVGRFHAAARRPAPLPPDSFLMTRHIAKAICGEVCEYHWHYAGDKSATGCVCDEGRVAVKKMAISRVESTRGARSAPNPEDALTEVGIYSYLSEQMDLPPFFLRLLAIFADNSHIWVVTELANGGDLSCLAQSRVSVGMPSVKRYTWQLLQAVAYLHEHGIGHRDISLDNVLLDKPHTEDGSLASARLADFGIAVRCVSPSGTRVRFFQAVGKAFYRAPECFVPKAATEVDVFAPCGSKPGDVVFVAYNSALCEVKLPAVARPGTFCKAHLWGYDAAPADVFACAMCSFILAWRSPIWQRAMLSDRSFAWIRGKGGGVATFEALLRSWGRTPQPDGSLDFVAEVLSIDPQRRPSAVTALNHHWFEDLHACNTN